MGATEPLSGCFCKGYKLSILLVLFYTLDVQTELFNVNENKPMQPSTVAGRNHIFFFPLLNIEVWTSTWQPGGYVSGSLSFAKLQLSSCRKWWGFEAHCLGLWLSIYTTVTGKVETSFLSEATQSQNLDLNAQDLMFSIMTLNAEDMFYSSFHSAESYQCLSVTGEHHW